MCPWIPDIEDKSYPCRFGKDSCLIGKFPTRRSSNSGRIFELRRGEELEGIDVEEAGLPNGD